ADIEGSGNFAGVRSPAVDALIVKMTAAKTKAELLPACHALERVIASSYYLIPQWTSTTIRMAYNAKRLARPEAVPPYAQAETWAMEIWWAK
ncbi:MAG: ABC transporter substrate-binding protein, partial [Burkholderiaceae bacterium]